MLLNVPNFLGHLTKHLLNFSLLHLHNATSQREHPPHNPSNFLIHLLQFRILQILFRSFSNFR